MKPAFSVLFLTTLIGAGQGLFLALFTQQTYAQLGQLPMQSAAYYGYGSLLALVFLCVGLFAAVFHLGKPIYMFTRAWRGVLMWRTSWMSRELIALPAFMFVVFLYTVAQLSNWKPVLFTLPNGLAIDGTIVIGSIGTLFAFALFVCTAMIYVAIKVLKEWSHPLTIVNFILLGSASGFLLAAAYSAFAESSQAAFFMGWAGIFTVLGLISRSAALWRNARLRPPTTMQSAIGIKHPRIIQKSQGAMGGSYNTREYFHGKSASFIRAIKPTFIVLAFLAPLTLLVVGGVSTVMLTLAFVLQYLGLLAERWYFFAEANHPQNQYYQTIG